jgi:hypothetical protein
VITIKVNSKDAEAFNRAITNLIATSKRDLRTVINQQAKLLATQFMHLTPPFAGGTIPKGDERGTTKADQKAGVEAVKRDILKTMTPPSVLFKGGYKDKRVEKWVKRKENHKIQAWFDNLPKTSPMSKFDVHPFDYRLHINRRVYGRRFRPTEQFKFVNEENKIKQYIREVQGRVGYSKAGWGTGVVFFGGKVPSWVQANIPISKGTAGVLVNEGNNYTVEISNSTKSLMRFNPGYEIAVRMRINALGRSYADYLLKNGQQAFAA